MYLLKFATKFKEDPRCIFNFDDREYIVCRNFLRKAKEIKEKNKERVISEYIYKRMIPPVRGSIRMLERDLDVYLSICLFSILIYQYG